MSFAAVMFGRRSSRALPFEELLDPVIIEIARPLVAGAFLAQPVLCSSALAAASFCCTPTRYAAS